MVTYAAGPVKSTVDYIMVRQEDKAKIRNVKVITSEDNNNNNDRLTAFDPGQPG